MGEERIERIGGARPRERIRKAGLGARRPTHDDVDVDEVFGGEGDRLFREKVSPPQRKLTATGARRGGVSRGG